MDYTTSNIDLTHYLMLKGINLNQIVSKNKLLGKAKENGNYIINLEDSDKGMGSHWVALKCFKKTCVYFDSYGIAPPREVISFCNKKKLIYSCDQIQGIKDTSCGFYCVYFLYHFNNLRSFKDDIRSLGYHLNLFLKPFDTSNTEKNVKILKRRFKEIYENDLKKYF